MEMITMRTYSRVLIADRITGATRTAYAKIVARTDRFLVILPENTGIRTHIELERIENLPALVG